jgi:hypothetical protein
VWNYVNAWTRLLCNGYTTYQNLSPTALYLLASDDTPKPILKKLERLAAENGTVKRADVQRLIDAAKQKLSPPKPPSKPVEAPVSDEIDDEEPQKNRHPQRQSSLTHWTEKSPRSSGRRTNSASR